MDNKVKYSVNKLPKAMNFILCILPILGLFIIQTKLDDDFYFLHKMGEYIVNNGFPHNDILSMHSSMELVVQQWLCDVLYYSIYDKLGTIGMICFVYAMFLVFAFLLYRLCKLVSNNFFVSIIITTFVCTYMAISDFITRPQIVTYIIILLLFYSLESYIKTKKVCWLVVLPLLSLFLINWHASMWWLLFVFMLPYLLAAVPLHFKKVNQTPCCSLVALIVIMLVMFGVGFINPYGVDAVTYLFGSYGVPEINMIIQEMQPTSFANADGKILFFVTLVLVSAFAFSKKKDINTRFLFLTLGTLVLGLSSIKGMGYFFIGCSFSLAYFLREFDFYITVTNSKRTKKDKIKLASLIVIFAIALGTMAFTLINVEPVPEEDKTERENLDEIVSVLNNETKDGMVLYTDFNTGQYLEFNGYKPYIDGRAEVFLEKNNGEFDYFKEYVKLEKGNIYYKDFVDKYGFTHLILDVNDGEILQGLKHDSDYQIICENKNYILFEKMV